MRNTDIAITYLECFCNGDVAGVGETLASDLRLVGPLCEFESAAQYLATLHANPPEACTYELIQMAETGNHVLVFYNYNKAVGSIVIGQLFGFREGKISEILLVFDSQRIAQYDA